MTNIEAPFHSEHAAAVLGSHHAGDDPGSRDLR